MTILLLFLAGCACPIEAELSCLGDWSPPTPGERSTHAYTVKNPTDDAPYANAEVHVFAADAVTASCGEGCDVYFADADGVVDITLPSGWFSYRVVGQPDGVAERRMDTLEVHAVHPPEPGGEFLNALYADSMEAIFTFTRGAPDTSLGRAVVRGVDCNEAPIKNLYPRVFRDDGEEVEPLIAYFNRGESRPAIGRNGSNADGRVFLGNLPVGVVRVELWGTADGEEVRVACDVLPSYPETTTTSRMRPLHDALPAACQ